VREEELEAAIRRGIRHAHVDNEPFVVSITNAVFPVVAKIVAASVQAGSQAAARDAA